MDEVGRLDILRYTKDCHVVRSDDPDNDKKSFLDSFDAGETIVVGDTEMDHDAAMHNGMPYYILNRGFRSKEFWDKKNVASYDDLKILISVIEDKK